MVNVARNPEKAFQDYFPGNRCFGCGPSNPIGHRIKSYWTSSEREETICIHRPQIWHAAATPDIMHGGSAGSVIDCHSIWTAMAARYEREGREFGTPPYIWWDVTRRFSADLIKKIPLDGERLHIFAGVVSVSGRKTVVEARIMHRGEIKARGEVVAVSLDLNPVMASSLLSAPSFWEKTGMRFRIIRYLYSK